MTWQVGGPWYIGFLCYTHSLPTSSMDVSTTIYFCAATGHRYNDARKRMPSYITVFCKMSIS